MVVRIVGMVIGVTPVTGIPLSFVSYGGSNMLTNMIGMGIVLSIAMRNKEQSRVRTPRKAIAL